MRKTKLLLAACAMLFSVSALQAKVDVTETYLKDADLSSLQGWGNPGRTDWKTDGAVNVVEFWNWSTQFAFEQEVKLPAGYYRLAVNAFYREGGQGNGTNNDMAWIFAGEDFKKNVVALNNMGDLSGYAGSNDLYRAATAFSQGKFSNEFDFNLAAETTLKIGFKGTCPNAGWCILGPVKLYEYSIGDYEEDFLTKKAAAEALYDSPMNATVLTNLKAAANATYSSIDEVIACTKALESAIAAANTSIKVYAAAEAALSQASKLSEDAKATFFADETVAALKTAYENGTLATVTAEQQAAVAAAYIAAYKSQGTDMTDLIVNPSFENGMNPWTCSTGGDTGAKENSNATYTMSGIDGSYLFNTWNGGAGQPVSQTITEVPLGVYNITAIMGTDAGKTLELYGNDSKGTMPSVGKETGVFVTVEDVMVADGRLTIKAGTADNSWYKADDFNLIFIRELTDDEKLAGAKASYDEALVAASLVYGDNVNAQAGSEGVALYEEMQNKPETADEYIAATNALLSATETFSAAVGVYNELAEHTMIAAALGVTMPTVNSETTAAGLKTEMESLIVSEYNAAKAYSLVCELGAWANTPRADQAGESWDGTTTDEYFDSWNQAPFAMTQTLTLPAGDYVLIAKGRASADGRITLTDGKESVTFAHKGSVGRGIAKDGTATFANDAEYANNNDGRGWEYRVLPFTSDGETPITLTFNWTTSNANWAGLDDIVLKAYSTETINITDAGYATYCSANALDFTNVEGLTAYTATMDGSTVKFEKVEGTVPAGTGLLVKGETAEVPVVASSETVVDNILVGVLEETGVDAGIYVLMKSETGAAFVKTENSFTVRANSAYLPDISNARIIAIESEATGIETVKAAKTAEAIYNLAGQRVVKAQKGLYIQNGKKHIVK